MLGCERELEATRRLSGKPSSCFSRYVCGVIVEDQLDCRAGRIGGIEQLEELDGLSATIAVSDQRMPFSGGRQVLGGGSGAVVAMTWFLPW